MYFDGECESNMFSKTVITCMFGGTNLELDDGPSRAEVVFVFVIVDGKHLVCVLLLRRVQLHVTVLPSRAPQEIRSTPSHEDDDADDDEHEQDAEHDRKYDRSDTCRLAAVLPVFVLAVRAAETVLTLARERMLAVACTRISYVLTRAAVGAEGQVTRGLAVVVHTPHRAIVAHACERARVVYVIKPTVTVADVTARHVAGLR